jgi:TRAP-type mannitol/chloroaromatic compound transport system permease large subunit
VKLPKELWFGFSLMALILGAVVILMPWTEMTQGHLGLLMLALIVVAILLGFPTAFTLMGMGVFFSYLAYHAVNPDLALAQTLNLFTQRTYGVMTNDVLIAVPLFVFMGYLVERAALIDRLFRSLHLAMQRVPGSLAVATIVTCAVFATATGIVGAVVTLMGLLALPAMLKVGYNTQVAAGAITAGGCLGILIPPSILLIVYGATAGVSVVQLYAGAFFPGLMLAALYVGYVIVLARWKPHLAPELPEAQRRVELSPSVQALSKFGPNPFTALWRGLAARGAGVPKRAAFGELMVTLLPAIALIALLGIMYRAATAPEEVYDATGLGFGLFEPQQDTGTGLATPPAADAPPEAGLQPAGPAEAPALAEPHAASEEAEAGGRGPVPNWLIYITAGALVFLLVLYWIWNWERLQIFKLLLSSFFPLAILILAVLGSIMYGLATPTEAAAVGAFGGFVLAVAYRFNEHWRAAPARGKSGVPLTTLKDVGAILKDSSYLTAKTTAMVCWLFVGSAIFSAAFALLGGQELVERWVLSMDLTPVQFMILAQVIIFILGWPLEWTEIIVIFMPIFVPLLPHFGIDPLFFGLLVALNLQTAFLSPPVAMAAFYLKGVAPPHVTLTQIFLGMLPFMGIQIIAIVLLYLFPGIGMWLPSVIYGR